MVDETGKEEDEAEDDGDCGYKFESDFELNRLGCLKSFSPRWLLLVRIVELKKRENPIHNVPNMVFESTAKYN